MVADILKRIQKYWNLPTFLGRRGNETSEKIFEDEILQCLLDKYQMTY